MVEIIIAVIVIAVIVRIVKAISSTNAYDDSRKNVNREVMHRPITSHGCAYPGWCQYTDLGTAGKAGYNTDKYCYCRKRKQITERVTTCTDFLSPGCNNDMCIYAKHDHRNNTVNCSFFNRIVAPQDSCEFFEENWKNVELLRQLVNGEHESQKK